MKWYSTDNCKDYQIQRQYIPYQSNISKGKTLFILDPEVFSNCSVIEIIDVARYI